MRAPLFVALGTSITLLASGVARAQDAGSGSAAASAVAPSGATSLPEGRPSTSTVPHSSAGSAASRAVYLTPGPVKPAWQRNGSWGWFVVASSIFVGAGLTGFGLGQTCSHPDEVDSCTKSTSLAMWGGLGITALGTAAGLLVVQLGHTRTQNLNFATVKLGPLGEFRLAPPLAAPSR